MGRGDDGVVTRRRTGRGFSTTRLLSSSGLYSLSNPRYSLFLNKDDVRTVEKSRAMEEIRSQQGKENLMLTDKDYTKMMIFIYS